MRWIGVVLGAGVLVGCASQPAPQLDAQGYTIFAGAWYEVNNCIESGSLSPDVGALGKRYVQSNLSRFGFNQSLFETEYRKIAATGQVSAARCNQLATSIMQQKQQTDIQNAANAAHQQQIQNVINNQPRQVYCNTVGGVTMCNGM